MIFLRLRILVFYLYITRGLKDLEGFSALNQLKLITSQTDVGVFVPPATSQVTPMAHLLFTYCLKSI